MRPGNVTKLEQFVSFLYAAIAMALVLMMTVTFLLNRSARADAEWAPSDYAPAAVSPAPAPPAPVVS